MGSLVAWRLQQTSPEPKHGSDLQDLGLMDAALPASAPMLPLSVLPLATSPAAAEPTAFGLVVASDGYLVTGSAALDSRCQGDDAVEGAYISGAGPRRGQAARCVVSDAGLSILLLSGAKTEAAELYSLPMEVAGLPVTFLSSLHSPMSMGRLVSAANAGVHAALEIEPPAAPPLIGSPVWTIDGRLVGLVRAREQTAWQFDVATLAELLPLLGKIRRGSQQDREGASVNHGTDGAVH